MADITEQELNILFTIASEEIRETEVFGSNMVVLPLTDLRFGTEHRISAQNADSEEKRLLHLSKAKAHFIRAANDAIKIRFSISLKRFRKFQENFSKFGNEENLPSYLDAVNTSNEIQHYLNLIDSSNVGEMQNFNELKEKANQLDTQLDKLSKNKFILLNSIKKSKRRSISFVYSSIAGLVVSIISVLISTFYFHGETSKAISAKITNLSNIQKSLSELQTYITDQKNLLQNLNKDISSLKAEKIELQQVVTLENEKVELVLRQYEREQHKKQWIDTLISFFVGVFSSTTATLILSYRKKVRNTPSIEMIVNTKGKPI